MKKNEIRVGGKYRASVSGRKVAIEILSERESGGWIAVNLDTGRRITIRTAGRLSPWRSLRSAEEVAETVDRVLNRPETPESPLVVPSPVDQGKGVPVLGTASSLNFYRIGRLPSLRALVALERPEDPQEKMFLSVREVYSWKEKTFVRGRLLLNPSEESQGINPTVDLVPLEEGVGIWVNLEGGASRGPWRIRDMIPEEIEIMISKELESFWLSEEESERRRCPYCAQFEPYRGGLLNHRIPCPVRQVAILLGVWS